MGEPTTRIFMPLRSAGDLIGRLELVSSRKPFSPQASGTTPDFSSVWKIFLPTSPWVSASMAA